MPHQTNETRLNALLPPRLGWTATVGGVVFLGAYLLVGPVSGALSSGEMPLPDAPVGELVAYYENNQLGVWAAAVLQAVSVVGFALFARTVLPVLRRTATPTAATVLTAVAVVSVVGMLTSSVLSGLLPTVAQSDTDTLSTLRMVSFWAGGVVNVAALGGFVFVASRHLRGQGLLGRTVWILGIVAGTLAMLSVLSLAVYYANAFLPLGRTLSMVWTVAAGVALVRRTESAPPNAQVSGSTPS